MSLKLIIFDFDGTLIDSEPGILKAIQQTVLALELPAIAVDQWRQMIGLPLQLQLATLLPPDRQQEIETGVETYRQAYREWGPLHSSPFEGIPEILQRVRVHVPLAIASSKQRVSIERVLANYPWINCFKPIVSPTEVTHPKPHPESLFYILNYHQCPPEQAIMIGDTHYDMQMAQAAGVVGWGVTWGIHTDEQLQQAGASRCFETRSCLLQALEQVLEAR